MDLTKVLQQLRDELHHLDAAILCIERLQGAKSRRGRPPAILSELRKAESLSEIKPPKPKRSKKAGA